MNKAWASLCLAVVLAGCGEGGRSAQPPLAGARIGGPFVLTDEDGHRFDSRVRLAGRYSILYFGYTFCPDVCPTDLATLGKGLRLFEAQDAARAATVQPLFVTIDPARDTPDVLKRYVTAFHPRLIGLTGSEGQIAAVAKAYAAPYSRQPGAPGTQGYLMQHSTAAILFGPDGQPIALVPVDADAKAVAGTLAEWVR